MGRVVILIAILWPAIWTLWKLVQMIPEVQ